MSWPTGWTTSPRLDVWSLMPPNKQTRHDNALRELIDEARRSGESRSAPRRHHLVPAFYLNFWAKGAKIRVTHLDEARSWTSSPKNAALQTDFYRVDSPDLDPQEVPPLLFETALSKFEQWGADFINAAIDNPAAPGRNDEMRLRFSLFMAMQYVRGRHFRAVARASMTDFLKLRYGQLTEMGIRHLLQDRGLEPTEENVDKMRRFIRDLNSGELTLGPDKASLVGISGRMVPEIGSYLFDRGWHIYQLPSILVTCDEPLVPIAGPPHARDVRAGVADASVVIFPLTPSLLLAMFDGLNAWPQRPYRLDYGDIADLNREITGAASVYAFETPERKTALALGVPKAPEAISRTEPAPVDAEDQRFLIQRQRPSRWANATPMPPWPVERWFRQAESVRDARGRGREPDREL
jgi:hypothetical protein